MFIDHAILRDTQKKLISMIAAVRPSPAQKHEDY